MTVKHTPGPWSSDGSGNITHQDKQPIAFVNWTAYGEGKANARLIVAAPDLLAALKSIAIAMDDEVLVHDDQREAMRAATAAIAKATYKEP